MEEPTNLNPAPSSAVADELTNQPLDSPHGSQKDDGVDFGQERGSESNEVFYTENGSRSVDKNQSSDTEDVQVRAKDSQTEPDEDVEIVLKNQHTYYLYCPCCGEDITKTVKLVKKSDPQPTKNRDTENETIDTENSSKPKDKKTKVPIPSWFPVRVQQLFHSVYDHVEDKVQGKKGADFLGINGEEPMIEVKIEKHKPGFPNWFFDVFAWLFLCIIIVLSIISTSPPPFIQPHLQLPSLSSSPLSSGSVFFLVPTFAALLLVIMAMMFRYKQRYHNEKGIESKPSSDTTSQETQNHDEQAVDPDQDSEMKKDNQKVHPLPVDPSLQEQPSEQIVDKENAEINTPVKTQAEIPNIVEPGKGSSNKVEILKSIVYGGLTESITSLCTVTSAAASGTSTLNVLALGVANLSSGLLLTVHSLQELIKEKPRGGLINTEDQKNSEAEEEDRYVQILGRRERLRLHSVIAISSFVVFGLIPPLVYGFSYKRRVEKRQEYKVLAVYAVSLVCITLLSIAKAYVSKKREYLKTLFRYMTMATTASGFSQFVGYMVSQWLEKSGFYDDSPETPRV